MQLARAYDSLMTKYRVADNPVVTIVLFGVLLRLLIMPFFAHVDLFSEFRRVVYSISNDIYFPQQNRLVTFYIEYLFVWLFFPFLENVDKIFYLEDISLSTSNMSDFYIFVNDTSIFRHLFIFKLPYLICDVVTMWLIWQFIDDKKRATIAVAIWVFNPITLFAVYFFGRYEAIPIMFIAATAVLLKKDKPVWAAICLALAINSREIYVVTAPIFIIALYDDEMRFWTNIKRIVPALIILAVAVIVPLALTKILGGQAAFSSKNVYQDSRANALYAMSYHWFYPLVFGYFLLLSSLLTQTHRRSELTYLFGSGLVIAVYFMVTGHSAHYVAWLLLFPVLLINYVARLRDMVIAILLLFLFWFVYRLFKTDVNLFTLFLAVPFNMEFALYKTFQQLYMGWVGDTRAIFEYTKVLNALKTAFTAVLVFLSIQMYRCIKTGDDR